MSNHRPGVNHRISTYLEASHGTKTFLYTVATAALIGGQASGVLPGEMALDAHPEITGWLIAFTGCAALEVVLNARRWRASRVVLRMMRDPRLSGVLPALEIVGPPGPIAPQQRPPAVSFIRISRLSVCEASVG
jgi:hypothetical protein